MNKPDVSSAGSVQAVDAASNNNAKRLLVRDVSNITRFFSRFAPELMQTYYGEEMWALFERGELRPDSPLTGKFVFKKNKADVDGVMQAIRDAREEATIRQQGRDAANAAED